MTLRGSRNQVCIGKPGKRLCHKNACSGCCRCIAVCFAAAMHVEYNGMFCRCHACQVWRYVLPLLLAAAGGCCCCCCCRFECRGQHMRLYTAPGERLLVKANEIAITAMLRRVAWVPGACGRFFFGGKQTSKQAKLKRRQQGKSKAKRI